MCRVLSAILLAFQLWTGGVAGLAPIPPAPFGTTILNLPGCLDQNPYEESLTHDCLVAKTAFALPNFCSLYPATTNCVIYLAPAFCFDGDIQSQGKMDDCLDQVPLGPCIANPTGRACSSGLFAGFALLKDPTPPNRKPGANSSQQWPGIFIPQNGSPDAFFGGAGDLTWDPTQVSKRGFASTIWAVRQFFEGIGKDLWNTGIEMAELLTFPFRETMKLDCYVSKQFAYSQISQEAGDGINAVCTVFIDHLSTAATYLERFELEPLNQYQAWGATTSQIIQALLGVVDGLTAVTATVKLVKLFRVIAEESGSYLRATTKVGEIIILRLRGLDTTAMEKAEAEKLLGDLNKHGFEDLVKCPGLKAIKARINSPTWCVTDKAGFNEKDWGEFIESQTAAEVGDALINEPASIPGQLPAPAAAANPTADEGLLRTEAVVMDTGESRLTEVEYGKRKMAPAEFPADEEEYGQPSKLYRPTDEAGTSAAEVPNAPPWPRPQVDAALVDDHPGTRPWFDIEHYHDDGPLQLFLDYLPNHDFDLDFSRAQYAGDETVAMMKNFEKTFQDGIRYAQGDIQVPNYWWDLQNSGLARTQIRDQFVQDFTLGNNFDNSLKLGILYGPDQICRRLDNIAKRTLLPKVEGIGFMPVVSPFHQNVPMKGILDDLELFFNGLNPKKRLSYSFSDLIPGGKGNVLYPGFTSTGMGATKATFVFSNTMGRLFGPLVERYSAGAYVQLLDEANYLYELVGRVPSSNSGLVYL